MKPDLLILRPHPGAAETERRAADLGLSAAVAPLFEVEAVKWEAPDPARFDALILTSANAARQAGPDLAAFRHLRCYAVGESTALAARQAGCVEVVTGKADGQALAGQMARDGVARAFHPCGKDHVALAAAQIEVETRIVYAAVPVTALPAEATAAIEAQALVLIHSPRAAGHFAALADGAHLPRSTISLAAISVAAAAAAGDGWNNLAVAAAPRDEALLELAASLCKTDGLFYGK